MHGRYLLPEIALIESRKLGLMWKFLNDDALLMAIWRDQEAEARPDFQASFEAVFGAPSLRTGGSFTVQSYGACLAQVAHCQDEAGIQMTCLDGDYFNEKKSSVDEDMEEEDHYVQDPIKDLHDETVKKVLKSWTLWRSLTVMRICSTRS